MEERTPEEAEFTMESEQTFKLGVTKVNRDKRNKNSFRIREQSWKRGLKDFGNKNIIVGGKR